jgi:hypothetical protein
MASLLLLVLGLIYVVQPLTATVAAVIAYASLRSDPDWRGVRMASLWIVMPWVMYLVGEIIVLRDPLEVVKGTKDFFVGVPTLASLAVGMGIAAASCWRWNVSRGCDRPDPMAR